MEFEPEKTIDMLHKVEQSRDFLLKLNNNNEKVSLNKEPHMNARSPSHLRRHAEDVGIILHEPPHAGQPRQSATRFVSMDDTELGHADGQLLVTPVPRVEDQTVAGTVHGLESPFLLLDVEHEHVVFVVLPVSGGFPEFGVVHVR